MTPIKVEFLNTPKVIPIPKYKRCWLTLGLLNCLVPNYRLEEDMNDEWILSNELNRSYPFVVQMISFLEMTEEQGDQFFIEASKLS